MAEGVQRARAWQGNFAKGALILWCGKANGQRRARAFDPNAGKRNPITPRPTTRVETLGEPSLPNWTPSRILRDPVEQHIPTASQRVAEADEDGKGGAEWRSFDLLEIARGDLSLLRELLLS